jgi:hypothetical protein
MSDQLKVGDDYRTNPLSLKPGGYHITVVYSNGKSFVYDKVKKPESYIRRIAADSKNGSIMEIHIDGKCAWKEDLKNPSDPWDVKI